MGYYALHLTVKDAQWWVTKLQKNGFAIVDYTFHKDVEDVAIYAYKPK